MTEFSYSIFFSSIAAASANGLENHFDFSLAAVVKTAFGDKLSCRFYDDCLPELTEGDSVLATGVC